jgi:hypothetical protein
VGFGVGAHRATGRVCGSPARRRSRPSRRRSPQRRP